MLLRGSLQHSRRLVLAASAAAVCATSLALASCAASVILATIIGIVIAKYAFHKTIVI